MLISRITVENFRTFAFMVAIATAVSLLFADRVMAQEDLNVTGRWAMHSDLSNATYRYFSTLALDQIAARKKKIDSIHDLAGWQGRQRWIHRTLQGLIGSFPPRMPLHPRITRSIRKDRYTLQNIVFESQPGYFVTSALYLPSMNRHGKKLPAVLYCSGHSIMGYREPVYQQAILNLVDKGFIVFAFDPVDQGERIEYADSSEINPDTYEPDKEHSYSGAPLFASGNSLAKYMIWDGIRALDYLLSRKEVDTSRIGITGRSGGGTQAAFVAAMDDRIKAAAPECYITNFARLIQSSGPQDAEQDLVNEIKVGFDLADVLTVRAPRPTLVISTTRDLTFNIQGAIETIAETSRAYGAYHQPDKFSFVIDDAPHASTKKNRQSMYAFFQKYLQNPGDSIDRELPLLTKSELQVTATGQVATAYHSETIFSLNRRLLSLTDTAESADRASGKSLIKETAKRLCGYQTPGNDEQPVLTGRYRRNGYSVEKYFVKGEGDYVIPFLLFRPDNADGRALLYLHPEGKLSEAQPGGELERLTKEGITVLAPDLLGIGETGPGKFQGDSYINRISYNIWYLSIMTTRSIVGVRCSDVVRLAHVIIDQKWAASVDAEALDELTPVLIHAAAFDSVIQKITLVRPLSSYRSFLDNRRYDSKWIYTLVPGAPHAYDLPELISLLPIGSVSIKN